MTPVPKPQKKPKAKNWAFMSQKKKGSKNARQKLIHSLDTIFSKLVRNHDANKCRKCGNSRVFCHHIFTRKYLGTRWLIQNGISLCHGCHQDAHTDPLQFHAWVKTWMGKDYDTLQWKAYAITKFTEGELEILKKDLQGKLKEKEGK